MQLMPATAREQAGKLGMSYDQGNLFDPDFNVTLGSSYFVKAAELLSTAAIRSPSPPTMPAWAM